VNVYPILPYCGNNIKYKQAAPKIVKIAALKPLKTFFVKIQVSNINKTSSTNVAMDLPYGVDFVRVKGPSAKMVDVEIDELENTVYFLTTLSTKPKRRLRYKLQVSLKLWAVRACFIRAK
jgi:hypothetical protein